MNPAFSGRAPVPFVAAGIWGLLGFSLFFYQAQFIPTVKWNAIELIIAQHLLEHGAYVTSLDYPSAITWRPVLPTLVVAFFRIWTGDPILIYRLVCGLSLGILAATMFLSARLLWSRPAAHTAAALTLVCPAITTYLIQHAHSYSHLVGLLFLGPALYGGLTVLCLSGAGEPVSCRRLAVSGLLWGCCYLCRSELLLFAVLEILVFGFGWVRQKQSLKPVASFALGLLAFVLPYNLYAGHVAERDGLLLRKTIYGLYASQGWADPAPDAGEDTEGDGYVYATKLYGDPVANGESVFRAIRHNPPAFLRRIRLNLGAFYRLYWDRNFFHPLWSVAVAALLVPLLKRALPDGRKTGVVFLFGLFLCSHFVLLFHVDPRYLSINIPALILLSVGWVHSGFQWAGARRFASYGFLSFVLVFVFHTAQPQFEQVRQHPSPVPSISALAALGRHFRATVPSPRLVRNREPHIGFIPPAISPLYPEDPIIVAYFTHSAWLAHGADGPFPRGKIYSFRECEDDYLYIPQDRVGETGLTQNGRVIATFSHPVLGSYALLQLHP